MEEVKGIDLGVKKVPADQAIPGNPPQEVPSKPEVRYPMIEDMTFRGVIQSEEQGYALLKAVQLSVNGLGTETLIAVAATIEKKPQLLQQAKAYLIYLGVL